MDLKYNIGKRVQEIRKSKKFTQEQLAEMIDVAQNTLSNIETGLSFFTAETFERLVNALDIEPQELFNFRHFQTNEQMLKEINELLSEHPEKISEFYRIAKAIIQ